MIRTADTCPQCGQNIDLAEVHGTWVATCDAECAVGEGDIPEDALADWSARASAARAPALTDLAAFIVPRSPEGWVFLVADPCAGRIEERRTLHGAHEIADACFGDAPRPIYYVGPRPVTPWAEYPCHMLNAILANLETAQ